MHYLNCRNLLAVFTLSSVLTSCFVVPKTLPKRQILWDIVSNRCETSRDDTHACLVVNRPSGYVVLRDRHGPVQTLIIPTAKITGIEDSQLLQPTAKNYFNDAWVQRHILDTQNKKAIEPRYLSFSVNSAYGRTQDQLHIHSSCLSKAVYVQLEHERPSITTHWQALPNKILGHTYLAKKITLAELNTTSPFHILSDYLQKTKAGHMAEYGLAMVSATDTDMILLATKLDLTEKNLGSIEEIQDTFCQVTQ
ncbi:CDP-diacylglycerol diphosphatase [Acinetobacter rathckeae]|uniref:CDP-diacylglycerol pyrophosphatase n=1 Tax=Acinetobacter rathckeae TaxID=2605272 RepID=UPI0018A2EA36|nr:CDP-diacylglycerol diphosphatase [Acinetobacter rathckeae]MBF7688915.1 CDP-diacylglycerol diphosphatase [Acinetobacter rathckeae]MBF7696314.1 CDP-diacylglycerol diphosphatase [Acinetobacter rathckeae]